jgi:hypothetical protein
VTYTQIKHRVAQAVAMFDPSQHDAHIWTWLDHEACNANHLRDTIRDVTQRTQDEKIEQALHAIKVALVG